MNNQLSKSQVSWARICLGPPPFVREVRRRGARRAGIRYERKVQQHFWKRFSPWYVPSPWIKYGLFGDSREQWCQPDGLVVRPDLGKIWIQETKLQHTAAAWFQLVNLYQPLVDFLFPAPHWTTLLLEVVRWYDPCTPFPGEHRLRAELEHVQPSEVGVLILSA